MPDESTAYIARLLALGVMRIQRSAAGVISKSAVPGTRTSMSSSRLKTTGCSSAWPATAGGSASRKDLSGIAPTTVRRIVARSATGRRPAISFCAACICSRSPCSSRWPAATTRGRNRGGSWNGSPGRTTASSWSFSTRVRMPSLRVRSASGSRPATTPMFGLSVCTRSSRNCR